MKTLQNIKRACALFAVVAVAMIAITSCSKDNDSKDGVTDHFTGVITTSLPSMPTFEPVECEGNVDLTWKDADKSAVTITLEEFSLAIQTPMGDREYTIEKIVVPNVECSKSGNNIVINQKQFEYNGQNMVITGTVSGELVDGVLTLRANYRPGVMPFEVYSVFVGK